MKSEPIKKPIILFLLLVFTLPLICVFLIKKITLFQSGVFNFVINGIEAMTPSLAALITTAVFTGLSGISVFLKKCYFDNIKPSYIFLAV